MPAHKDARLGNIHKFYNWEFATEVERLAYTTFRVNETGLAARQLSDNSIWLLMSTDGEWLPIWSPIAANKEVHIQTTPSTDWVFTHNLNKVVFPSVHSLTGKPISVYVDNIDVNTTIVNSLIPITGYLILTF